MSDFRNANDPLWRDAGYRSGATALSRRGLLAPFSHEGGRSFDPQAFDFVLEIAGHVVGAMIVTQLQSTRHAA